MERKRLTASAALLKDRIILNYDGNINNNQTNYNQKLKIFLATGAPGVLPAACRIYPRRTSEISMTQNPANSE